MSEVAKTEAALKKEKLRSRAERDFGKARDYAADNGLRLLQHTDAYYSLRRSGPLGFLLNIYPGTQHWQWVSRPAGLRLEISRKHGPWALVDVIAAAVQAGKTDGH